MKKRFFNFLKILFVVLIIAVVLFNSQLTGSVINLGNIEFNLSTILVLSSLFWLIFVFLLEKTLGEAEEDTEKGTYKGVDYMLKRAGNGKRVALIAPGMGGTKSDYARSEIAKEFAKQGVSSIRYDIQKGATAPTLGEMTAKIRNMNKLAKEKGFGKGAKILYGTSLSGYAPLIAAAYLPGVKEVVLRAPLSDLAGMVRKKGGEKALKAWKEKGKIPKEEYALPWELGHQYASRVPGKRRFENIAKRLAEKGTRIRVYHGTKDERIPIAYSEKLVKALKERGIKANLRRVKGAGHEYEPGPWNKALRGLGRYLPRKKK